MSCRLTRKQKGRAQGGLHRFALLDSDGKKGAVLERASASGRKLFIYMTMCTFSTPFFPAMLRAAFASSSLNSAVRYFSTATGPGPCFSTPLISPVSRSPASREEGKRESSVSLGSAWSTLLLAYAQKVGMVHKEEGETDVVLARKARIAIQPPSARLLQTWQC